MIKSKIKSTALALSRKYHIVPAVIVEEIMLAGADIALGHTIHRLQHETKDVLREQKTGRLGTGFDYPVINIKKTLLKDGV